MSHRKSFIFDWEAEQSLIFNVVELFLHLKVAFILCLCWCGRAHAGAWNQAAGQGQIISTSSWSHAGQIFDDDFEAVPLRGFTKTETRLYIEHGLTDWLTIVGNGAFQSLNFRDEDSRFDFDGLDDTELGLQFKVFAKEGLATSIRVSYIVDSRLDNQAVDVLRGGDQYELRGLIGQSRETLIGDLFYDAQIAARTEQFSGLDGVQGALTLGIKPTDRWLIMTQNFLNFSNDDVRDGFDIPKQTQLVSQLSIARQYRPGRYIQLGAGRTILGQNIVKERSVFIGLWTEY